MIDKWRNQTTQGLEETIKIEGILTRASRTSMTKSESLRRSRMARVALAMWPGNQLTLPPPLMKPNSPINDPFFTMFLAITTSLLTVIGFLGNEG